MKKNIDNRMKDFERLKVSRFPNLTSRSKNLTRKTIDLGLKKIRTGPETVVMVPPVARGGNWLYEWLRAYHISSTNKAPAFLIKTTAMSPWLEEFPKLKNLTKEASHKRFRSLRVIGVSQNIQDLFTPREMKEFITEYLLSESFVSRQKNSCNIITDKSLVINVRRGDYYSNNLIHHEFGIDTISYIKLALNNIIKEIKIDKIVIVSDDLEWCSNNLGFLSDTAPTIFEKIGSSMFDDLATISVASYLILTNTTFGYWGGYIATFTQGAQVWVPDIHERANLSDNRHRPMQHLDSWNVVKPPQGVKTWLESDEI